ncbi:MAG: DUF484 family protein [Gammaproteobacteria bacterium]
MSNADDVAQYLKQHPDFFDSHPELLEHLHVPHGGNGTVSLVERQLKVLRERQAASRERLAELVRVARNNDQLADRIHKLTLRLLHAKTSSEVCTQVETSMREDFDVTPAYLALDAERRPLLESLLSAGKPRCGHFPEAQRKSLLGEEGASIASMALVPIGPGATLGALLLGSTDVDRFNPAVSTDFLARIGEMIAAALIRCGNGPRV